MPSFSVTCSDGSELSNVGPDELLSALQDCDDQLVLRCSDWPGRSAVARRQDVGWRIELADDHKILAATVPITDAALDVLRSWAEEDDWWAEAFSWRTTTD